MGGKHFLCVGEVSAASGVCARLVLSSKARDLPATRALFRNQLLILSVVHF